MSMTVERATKVVEGHIQFLKENWKPHPDYDVIEALGMMLSEFRELKEKATAIKADGFSDHLLNMGYTKGIKDGYAKAIDEFAEACKNHIFCQTFGLHSKTIDEIATKLRGE